MDLEEIKNLAILMISMMYTLGSVEGSLQYILYIYILLAGQIVRFWTATKNVAGSNPFI